WLWKNVRPFKFVVGGFQYLMDSERRENVLIEWERSQITGTANCDFLIFVATSDDTEGRMNWQKKMRVHCSPRLIAEAEATPWIVKTYCDLEGLMSFREESGVSKPDPKERFQVHFANAMNSQLYHFPQCHDVMEGLWVTDRSYKFLVTTPSLG